MSTTDDNVTPDDIEAKLRELFDDARDEASDAKGPLTTILGIVAIVILLLSYIMGRKAGRKRTTVVEVRRM